jgi:energy-dependent translational throttle protein EttA
MPSDTQVIYSMTKVGKVVPPNKQILRDISLGFYYGAKIGVLGLNGAGKSSLLRIIAGVDKDYVGEIAMSKGYTVGLLEQEPKLDETGTVISVVKEAVQPIVEMLRRFDEVNAKFAEPDADFDALVAEQGKLQEQLDKHDAWNLESHLEVAMDALRCPPAETPIKVLSGACRADPAAADRAGHPPAGRTHQPPRRRVGGLAGTPLARLQRHGHRGDA